jgi:NADPH2:quinone reductase
VKVINEEVVVRAVQVTRLDGPASVEVRDVPEPTPGPGQVLVDVKAVGLNFPDVLQSKGLYQYKPELPFTIASEFAGVVRSAPDGASVKAGDRVAAFSGGSAAAEVVAVDAEYTFPLPDDVSFAAGACLPMNYLTADFTLRVRGHLQPGQTVLVHGAAGGVGTACIQLAVAMGAEVIGVVSTEAKAEVARTAGARHAVLVDGFKDAAREITGGTGVDLVVDPVGGDRFTDSLRSLATLGKVLVVGFTAGDIPTVKVNRVLLTNTDVVGVGWGAFAMARPGYLADQWEKLLPHIRSGALTPLISATYPLEKAVEALEVIDQRAVTGKVALEL